MFSPGTRLYTDPCVVCSAKMKGQWNFISFLPQTSFKLRRPGTLPCHQGVGGHLLSGVPTLVQFLLCIVQSRLLQGGNQSYCCHLPNFHELHAYNKGETVQKKKEMCKHGHSFFWTSRRLGEKKLQNVIQAAQKLT